MNKERYSIYDFPELLYNSKILTNRQRCILLCLFSYLNLKGGGAYTIDIISEKTGIKKNHIYEELAKLYYEKEGEKIPVIRKEGKKLILDVKHLREFLNYRIQKSQFRTKSESPKIGLNKSQNGTKTSPKMGLKKSQNGTKSSPKMGLENQDVAQEPQSPEPPVDNIIRKKVLDKNSQIKVLEGDNNKTPEKGDNVLDDSKKGILNRAIELALENLKNEFKKHYKAKFNAFPLLDEPSTKRIKETLAASCETAEEAKDLLQRSIKVVPAFFELQDRWVQQNNYSWRAFSYRLSDLLSQSVSLKSKVDYENPEEYLKRIGVL